ncbi:hypothetical protein UVI_02004510 [Ustilaginoidea virens]|nr:hypothetical protein UVI_02004510 [Ustilaginoidea virens]
MATPTLFKHVNDPAFTLELAKLLSAAAETRHFHLLCAIVDCIAPAPGEPVPAPGVSVLRGELHSLMPRLWQPEPPLRAFDKDSVAAVTFRAGSSLQTLPLARTTFLNSRPSTLLAGRFDVSGGSPRLKQAMHKQWQQVNVWSADPGVGPDTGMGLWAPLSPVTRPRRIVDSFGNIVRGVDVEGKPTPASTELEDAINRIHGHRLAAEASAGPMGVWALVSPASSRQRLGDPDDAPDPEATLDGKAASREDVESTAAYLQSQHRAGCRLFQVLSGGGGWGAKKGLLSLDPRETFYAPPEEEDMERFMQAMSNSGLVPTDSYIQFFVSGMAPSALTASSATGVVFGVPTSPSSTEEAGPEPQTSLLADHFGALSSQGIYTSPLPNAKHAFRESKLSVPGSRVFFR